MSARRCSPGGKQFVSSGGVASGATVFAFSLQTILSSGTAIGTILSNGQEEVSAGGTAIDTTLVLGGKEYVSAGGTDFGALISDTAYDQAYQYVYGLDHLQSAGQNGAARHGWEIVSGSGFDSGARISGGEQDVYGSPAASPSLRARRSCIPAAPRSPRPSPAAAGRSSAAAASTAAHGSAGASRTSTAWRAAPFCPADCRWSRPAARQAAPP